MAIYRLVDRLNTAANSAVIERVVPRGGIPERFVFEGTREQAQAQVDRLNALAVARLRGIESESPLSQNG